MIDDIAWLGKKEELAFRETKFSGKNAGKIYQYSNHVDGLIRTRAIICAMAVLVFYPVVVLYFVTGQFSNAFFFERVVFSIVFIVAGVLFNKFRIPAILIASIPMLLMAATYLFNTMEIDVYRIAYSIAILVLILGGLYHNHKVNILEEELSNTLLENQLLDKNK